MSEKELRKAADRLFAPQGEYPDISNEERMGLASVTSDDQGQFCIFCDWFATSFSPMPDHDADCPMMELGEALADDPDVAAILREIATLGEIHNESLALALLYRWVEGRFHIRLTETGWEWTDDQTTGC